jgi:hypothetical protein
MQTTNRAPAAEAEGPPRGVLGRLLSVLRGDRYTVGTYPPPAADAKGGIAQDRDELPLHFAPKTKPGRPPGADTSTRGSRDREPPRSAT